MAKKKSPPAPAEVPPVVPPEATAEPEQLPPNAVRLQSGNLLIAY